MNDANPTAIELSKLQVPNVDTQENWDLKWRRNKTMQLLSEGKAQWEVAEELNVHESTISRGIQKMREEVDAEHTNWVKHIAFENELQLVGLTEVLKDLWAVVRNERLEIGERLRAYLRLTNCFIANVHNARLDIWPKELLKI